MAIVFPQGVEVFSNVASCVAAAGSGGTNGTSNPAAGTTESWTVSTGSTSFPVANFGTGSFTGVSSTPPGNYFYVTDSADTTHEIVLVYDNNSSGSPGTTWKVERGMNGACAAHASGATWVQVVSPFTLQNMIQKPGAYTGAASITVAGATETVLASYTPLATSLVPGAAWYGVAFGAVGPTLGSGTSRVLTVRVMWGGSGSIGGTYTTTGSVQLATITTGTNCVAFSTTTIAAGGSFDINCDISLFSATQANANINMFYTTAASAASAQSTISVVNTASASPWGSTGSPITISGATSNTIFLTAHWGTGGVTNGLVTVAPYIRAEA